MLKLPNGMELVNPINTQQAIRLYKEIFDGKVYLRNGIKLHDGCCVLDVGANIGMFTLFLNTICTNSTTYCFEPILPIFKALESNLKHNNINANYYNVGLSNQSGEANFIYYKQFPGISGQFVDPIKNLNEAKNNVQNILNENQKRSAAIESKINQYVDQFYKYENVTCRLRTLSEIIKENRISKIDLLKIDAESSEYLILEGIKKTDWLKIEQIIIEVHNEELLDKISSLLIGKGYSLQISANPQVENGSLPVGLEDCMLFAFRT
ncbi:FkbM family methyltransferase [Paenibacillus sp. JGP012]|uniref:FkbM family methyltransferase n=1 Tax=Paenibacillus sp. JGP012 TaxID=2735914 RepID=UPI001617E7E3|nr:FkbM family methyltransferase [Paenibacillus sp. JGP012]MBB6022760.1 FkbM family methyltransferase [Paenibacillus sp. JGP012]